MAKAVCYRSGEIEIVHGRNIPQGSLLLLKGRFKDVRRRIETRAQHAYDGKTFLVPGLPEAADDDAALAAVLAFQSFLTKPMGRTA